MTISIAGTKWVVPMEGDAANRARLEFTADGRVGGFTGCNSVSGTWRLEGGELTLTQTYQKLTGTMTTGSATTPITGGLRGEEIELSGGGTTWRGRVRDGAIEFTDAGGRRTRATRVRP